jgi:putative oxidoreductase
MNLLYPGFPGGRIALGLLAVRLVAGTAFVYHGWPKLDRPFSWMERPDAPSGVPGFLQAAAAFSEFAGGSPGSSAR